MAFRWRGMFRVIADAFDMELADPAPVNLTKQMSAYGQLWSQMVKKSLGRDGGLVGMREYPPLDIAARAAPTWGSISKVMC
jgi:hypothetical protein